MAAHASWLPFDEQLIESCVIICQQLTALGDEYLINPPANSWVDARKTSFRQGNSLVYKYFKPCI